MSKIEVGDVVRCVNPRTWPFLEKGAQYVVARVFVTGEFVKLEGQPPMFEMFLSNGVPLIDWLPVAMFTRVG